MGFKFKQAEQTYRGIVNINIILAKDHKKTFMRLVNVQLVMPLP